MAKSASSIKFKLPGMLVEKSKVIYSVFLIIQAEKLKYYKFSRSSKNISAGKILQKTHFIAKIVKTTPFFADNSFYF
jgi:hypothetical protein